jgi:predicted ester cyclase
MLVGAFPDAHFMFNDVIAEGDRVAIRWTVTMTHAGDQLGFPATGRRVTLEGSSFLVIKNGKIVEGWNQMEFQGLIHSLKSTAEEHARA